LRRRLLQADEASQRRRARIERQFALQPPMPFRQADWDAAKSAVLRPLLAGAYPAAQLSQSQARIDPAHRLIVAGIRGFEPQTAPRCIVTLADQDYALADDRDLIYLRAELLERASLDPPADGPTRRRGGEGRATTGAPA
jgi:hypothetical protein